jgi:hypothetical protein
VTPDGDRFLILAPRAGPRSFAYTIVLNWKTALLAGHEAAPPGAAASR